MQYFSPCFKSLQDIDDIHHACVEHNDHVRFFYLAVDLDRLVIDADERDNGCPAAFGPVERACSCVFPVMDCGKRKEPCGGDAALPATGVDADLKHCRSPRTRSLPDTTVPDEIRNIFIRDFLTANTGNDAEHIVLCLRLIAFARIPPNPNE